MASEQELLASHRGWLGNLVGEQVGLVVTAPALVRAQAFIDTSALPALQQRFLALVPALAGKSAVDLRRARRAGEDDDDLRVEDFPALFCDLFEWPLDRLAGAPGGPPLPDLVVRLDSFGDDRLEPTYALLETSPEGAAEAPRPLLLVRVEALGTDLDKPLPEASRRWAASPEARFERLLRERDLPLGLLTSGPSIRLVYAPRTETAGSLNFPVKLMTETGGRDVLGGLVMLMRECLLSGPVSHRLPAILRESRRYQNEVSSELAEQVLGALGDLLAGFQGARALSGGALLEEELREDRPHIYGGLLTTLMRLVFLLYAGDQDLLPSEPIFVEGYSLTALYERLRDDDARYHDTMDQRFGAYAQVLALFSMIFHGARHKRLKLPPRLGDLFDPNAYPFLEGRPYRSHRGESDRIEAPRVSDGTVLRVLHKLLFLGPERISYRTLDVEQIGSVYEAMMGYTLEVAEGPSLALRPHHVVVDLGGLLAKKAEERVKALGEVDCKLGAAAAAEVKKAKSTAELGTALQKSASPRRPGVLAPGSLYLQPTEERRRSGSHYTPRELTGPIVRKTLAPILERLGESEGGLTAAGILSLKVCDPAMGSGAFLVEACRQLADALEGAWKRRPVDRPEIPPDESENLHARRLVAQRCLYGVDKNPFAVALAKLSLWLVTLAKDHPFTFLDHALRQGDSLVGLGREQIASFHWSPGSKVPLLRADIEKALRNVEALRGQIHALAGSDDMPEKKRLLREADDASEALRRIGDLVVEVFFSETKDKAREKRLSDFTSRLSLDVSKLPEPELGGLRPFHWEIEFPEVFSRENPGFDAFVGNPPFLGGKRISSNYGSAYKDWLSNLHVESSSNADLVAHFFRRTFDMVRRDGTIGLIATNTIAQGDTRATGLRWICVNGGLIYDAVRRYKWPGMAAVIVSVVNICRTSAASWPKSVSMTLNGRRVEKVSAFLFHQGSDNDPARLSANENRSFIGCDLKGQGFTFEDDNPEATSLREMRRLIDSNARNQERIFEYIGGEELNTSPRQDNHRYVISFGDMSEEDARRWPDLIAIVEEKVRPARLTKSQDLADWPWWQFWRIRRELTKRIHGMKRLLANSQVSGNLAFSFQPTNRVFAHTLNLFAFDSDSAFAVLQARPHEVWARFLGSSMKDDLRYTPSDCFETFPFPEAWDQNAALEAAGKAYYEYRAALMVKNQQGLTATYNRFHDPDEQDPEILRLRELHDAMDRAVLDAYRWTDIKPTCAFLLDYEEDEEDEDETAGKRRKKKPWRYRWPDDVRDEVLARLLALNQERAAAEKAAAPPPKAKSR